MFDTVPAEWVAEYAQLLRQRLASGDAAPDDDEPGEDAIGEPGVSIHYLSSVEGMRVRLLLGPFATAREASLWTYAAKELLFDLGQVAAASSVRVTRVLSDPLLARPGELNHLLGADSSS